MAHQTGISSSEDLKEKMSTALKGSLRFLQVIIDEETMIPGASSEPNGSWEDDLDTMIQPLLNDKEPCYILYRLDERNSYQNYLWVFMMYIPDFAIVKKKMLYAATKATLKKEFSQGVIVDDVAATEKKELSLEGYKKHVESQLADAPLTESEQELKMLHEAEEHADIGTQTRQSHLHGVAFPIKPAAMEALKTLQQGSVMYVQLSVDVKNEEILLETTEDTLDADSLSKVVPNTSPRYHFYIFKHTHEGDYKESIIFVYSSPGFKSSIKERMLYSSCKEPLIAIVEQDLKLTVDKKIEISSGDDLSEKFLMDEVHPPTHAHRQKFMKPPPPSNRRRSKSPNNRPKVSAAPPNGVPSVEVNSEPSEEDNGEPTEDSVQQE